MPLPKSWTTVTPLSRTIAIILFAFLPAIAFFSGVRYQQKLDEMLIKDRTVSTVLKKPTPSLLPEDPTIKNWHVYTDAIYGFSVKYPPYVSKAKSKASFYTGVFSTPLGEGNERLIINGIVSTPSISTTYLGLPVQKKIMLNDITWAVLVSNGYCDAGLCGEPFIAYQTVQNKSRITFIFTNTREDSERNRKILSTIHFTPQACPKDVTYCRDGRTMGRTGPDCSFPCQK